MQSAGGNTLAKKGTAVKGSYGYIFFEELKDLHGQSI